MALITLSYKGDEEYISLNQQGNKLEMDMVLKEQKQHQSPTETLLSAVAACAAVDIVSMIKKRRKTFIDLKAEVDAERREEHPRAFTKIHIKYIITSPDLKEEELARIIDLAVNKYCSVAATLKPDVTHSFEIVR
ncbi:MAG: OsmC family protein [Cytophagales bacterium]|nr:OsmC family protein [Cytophagales bacterium]